MLCLLWRHQHAAHLLKCEMNLCVHIHTNATTTTATFTALKLTQNDVTFFLSSNMVKSILVMHS